MKSVKVKTKNKDDAKKAQSARTFLLFSFKF